MRRGCVAPRGARPGACMSPLSLSSNLAKKSEAVFKFAALDLGDSLGQLSLFFRRKLYPVRMCREHGDERSLGNGITELHFAVHDPASDYSHQKMVAPPEPPLAVPGSGERA